MLYCHSLQHSLPSPSKGIHAAGCPWTPVWHMHAPLM